MMAFVFFIAMILAGYYFMNIVAYVVVTNIYFAIFLRNDWEKLKLMNQINGPAKLTMSLSVTYIFVYFVVGFFYGIGIAINLVIS